MSAAEFSTKLGAWCAKFPNQQIAAAELGVSYGTLMGWLGTRLPCALTRAAVLRRVSGGLFELTENLTPVGLAARCRLWRGQHGLSQIQAAALLLLPCSTFRSIESMKRQTTKFSSEEILHRISQPVNTGALTEVKHRERPVEPQELARALRHWRREHRLNRRQAADALKVMGFFTTARTIWVWETARMLPRQPLTLMQMLEARPPQPPPKPKPDNAFGRQLRAWRKGRGLTQVQALAALGAPGDQAKLSDWERGKKIPKNAAELVAKMEAAS